MGLAVRAWEGYEKRVEESACYERKTRPYVGCHVGSGDNPLHDGNQHAYNYEQTAIAASSAAITAPLPAQSGFNWASLGAAALRGTVQTGANYGLNRLAGNNPSWSNRSLLANIGGQFASGALGGSPSDVAVSASSSFSFSNPFNWNQFVQGALNGLTSSTVNVGITALIDPENTPNGRDFFPNLLDSVLGQGLVQGYTGQEQPERISDSLRELGLLSEPENLPYSPVARDPYGTPSYAANYARPQLLASIGANGSVLDTTGLNLEDSRLLQRRAQAVQAYRTNAAAAHQVFADINAEYAKRGQTGSIDHQLAINSRIVSDYAQFGLDNPEFVWAQLAASVAYDVRLGVLASEHFEAGFSNEIPALFTGSASNASLQSIQEEIIQAQINVYNDVLPLAQVYAEFGGEAAAFVAENEVFVGRRNWKRPRYCSSMSNGTCCKTSINRPIVNAAFKQNSFALQVPGYELLPFVRPYNINVGHGLTIRAPHAYRTADITQFDQRWEIARNAVETFAGYRYNTNAHELRPAPRVYVPTGLTVQQTVLERLHFLTQSRNHQR